MLQISEIRNKTEDLAQKLKIKGFDAKELLDKVVELDVKRRSTQTELDEQLSEQNKIAKEIGMLFKNGKKDDAEVLKQKSIELKESSKVLEQEMDNIASEIHDALLHIPNIPNDSVPPGNSDADNIVVRDTGEPLPKLAEGAMPHWELAKKYDLIDFELGVKVSGAGFPIYIGKGAKLQRALINYFLDKAHTEGYKEFQAPILINEESGFGTGQLPDKEGQMYHVTGDNMYLIPTAEVPLTNMYRDHIIDADELPVKVCGYTPCFRREAGSYGKDVRGLNRLHQFDKVEIVQITKPDNSYETLENMRSYVSGLIEDLELPFRVLKLCGGDLSFASALTYDMEVYSAAQDKWLEVSSVSNFEYFQANRMKLRYREKQGKPQLAHTLNGSALALPRIVAALLENNQMPEGIRIPKALQPYTGFELID